VSFSLESANEILKRIYTDDKITALDTMASWTHKACVRCPWCTAHWHINDEDWLYQGILECPSCGRPGWSPRPSLARRSGVI
jgi:hypothetical protein